MPIEPARRITVFTESVIREMTRLSLLHGGVNLAQGFPDFPAPEELKEAAVRAIRDDVNQYAVTWGAPRLRAAIARKATRYNRLPADPQTMVTVTCGATEAMAATLIALLEPEAEVVVFEPFYENYVPDIRLAGGIPRFVALNLQQPEAPFDPERLRAAFTPRTRAIIINTPHNPGGKVFSRSELETIGRLCQEYDVLAITDEIYEHILYDGREHISIGSLPGMADRTVTISGLSKTFAVTGWRLGYIIAHERLTNAIRSVHDYLTVCAPAPLQEAGITALEFGQEYYEELQTAYTRRRDRMFAILQAAGFRCRKPGGAYYIMTDISDFGWESDTALAQYLVREFGVATVPGSSFYEHKKLGAQQIRFAFPKTEDTLQEAEERLQKFRTQAIAKSIS